MPDALEDVSEALRAHSTKRLARVLTSSSILVITLYVLGFIYLKTYLAVFGFQIELASLSLPNLVLAHRFFVGQHFFVGAGLLQAYLALRFGRAALKREWWSSLLLLAFPLALLPAGWSLSTWSEANTPVGFNIQAKGLWLPFLLGWVLGALALLVARQALKPPRRVRDALWYVVAVFVLAILVFSYRLYASVTAQDRLATHDLERLEGLRVENIPGLLGPCDLVYADTDGLYLQCGPTKLVVNRESVTSYSVRPK